MSTQTPLRSARRSGRLLAPLVLVWCAACDPTDPTAVDLGGPIESSGAERMSPEGDAIAIVSDPVEGGSTLLAHVGSSSRSDASQDDDVVYASLPPGSVSDASRVEIVNLRVEAGLEIRLVDGGFDPVLVAAVAGDTLRFSFTRDTVTVIEWSEVVPRRSMPDVVRTSPMKGKRDVALRALPVIVFSEPMDDATLAPNAIQLWERGGPEDEGIRVDGVAAFVDATRLVAQFVPADPLKHSTGYELVITGGNQDLDGDPLQMEVRVQFTTGAPGAPAALAFGRSLGPINTLAGFRMGHPIAVVVTDAAGNEFPNYSDPVELSLVVNPTGASLGGVTEERVEPGYASWGPLGNPAAYFDDVRIDLPGEGYVLMASAPGLESAVSAPFDVVAPGEMIAFDSPFGLSVASADGQAVARFLGENGQGGGAAASWAPDGERLVYGWGYTGWASATGPTDLLRLLLLATGGAGEFGSGTVPAWSPDGLSIASVRGLDPSVGWDSGDIYVRALDGGPATRVTRGGPPAWSPDGTVMAFVRDGGIYTVRPDGTDLTRLVDADRAGRPAYSPDGSRIAFSCADAGLCLLSMDGSGVEPVSLPASFLAEYPCAYDPSWSPDGTRIAFVADCADILPSTIAVVDLATGEIVRFGGRLPPEGPGLGFSVFWPAWRPAPS